MNRTNWFTRQKMSWKKVIALAVGTAALTAVLNLIPALANTSFQDIAVNLECWTLFAVFIIVNCRKWQEAAVKTFVFFLISQPLIYLIEAPFSPMGLGLFQYYKYWFIITVLTLPGAVIAFQVKRKSWLSVAVLSVANAFLGYMAADYFWQVKANFPHHLLSLCFCIALALFFVFTLLDRKAFRAAAVAVILVSTLASLFLLKPDSRATILLDEGDWTCTVENTAVADVELDESSRATVSARQDGTCYVTFTNERGETKEYFVTVSGGGIYINSMED